MKNLKKLESLTPPLLKSKSYGLAKDKLWFLARNKLVKELGYAPPKGEVHIFKYDHEKACADCFVSLALTGRLLEWLGEGSQESEFINDRKFRVDEWPFYLEVEISEKGREVMLQKLDRYINHFRKTGEQFKVLISVPTEKRLEEWIYLFEERRLGNHYLVTVHKDFVNDPMNASLTSRFDVFTLSNHHSNHVPSE
jgi:disulfide oxidoreductase YuzD